MNYPTDVDIDRMRWLDRQAIRIERMESLDRQIRHLGKLAVKSDKEGNSRVSIQARYEIDQLHNEKSKIKQALMEEAAN